jgi:putative membrane protein insertion efficiency factor
MLSKIEILTINFYQKVSHPIYSFLDKHHINPCGCRYTPSCSEYTVQALKKYGALKGTFLGFKRLVRCRPPYGGNDPLR